jgi:hypothetical protein
VCFPVNGVCCCGLILWNSRLAPSSLFGAVMLFVLFGPKKDEVTGEWRKIHAELNDLYSGA